MIANVSKTNNSKRLVAAIAVFAMIACCLAVVLPSEDLSAEPIKPTAKTDPFAGIDGIAYDATNGVYTVSKATTITLDPAKEYGTEQNPLNVRFVINDGASLTFTNSAEQTANVFIQYVITDWNTAHVLINSGAGEGDKAKVTFDGNVNVSLSIDKASTVTQSGNCHLLCDVDTDVTDGATLTLSQTANVGGKAYYEGDDGSAKLTIDNAKVVLDHSGGIGPQLAMTEAILEVTNPRAGNAFINVADGSTIADSKIVIPQQDFSDNQGTSVYIPTKGTSGVSITDSDLDLGNSYLVLVPGAELKATGSTIDANAVALRDGKGTDVTITGGTINANFGVAYPTQSGTPAAKANYTLDGATLGNSNIVKDVTVTAGTNGIGISGTVTATDGSTITLNNAGMSVYAGAKADLSAADVIIGQNVKISVGKDASCTTPSSVTEESIETFDANTVPSVTDYNGLVENMKLGYTKITLGDEIQINENIDLGATAITASGTNKFTINEAGVSVTFNGGSYKGPITVKDVTATVDLNGTFTLTGGSMIVKDLTGTTKSTIEITESSVTTGATGLQLTGALNSELEVTINTTTAFVVDLSNLNITSSGKLTFIEKGTGTVTYTANGTVSVYGQIMAQQNIEISVQKESTFRAYGGSVIQDKVTIVSADPSDETIIINIDGAMHTLTINDDINSSNTYGQTQTVVIGSTLDIVSGTTIIIQGQFVVNEGVTLTIQNGAVLKINGTTSVMDVNGNIIIENGGQLIVENSQAIDIAGSVQIYGTMDIDAGKVTIQEGGNVTVAVEGMLDIAQGESTEIKAGATLDILGKFTIGAITNAGTINLTGAVMSDASEITLKNGGAVNVNSYTVGADRLKLTVTDGQNDIEFTAAAKDTGFSGAVITAASVKDAEDKEIFTMSVSGSIGAVDGRDDETGTTPAYTVAINGNTATEGAKVAVSGDLTVGEKVAVTNNGKLEVSGTVTTTAGTTPGTFANANSGVIDVTGTITINGAGTATLDGTVNAAYYTITGTGAGATSTTTYTTFENAVQSGATRVTVGVGNATVVVKETVTVPGTVTTVAVTSTATLQIGDADNRGITVTIADGARTNGGKIVVFATLTFENNRNDNAPVTSDVVINDEPARTYTNLYTALASGAETVTLAGPVELTSNIEVPEGTTLVVPAGTGVTFNAGVTMTVNGVVQTAVDLTGKVIDGTTTVTFDEKSASNTADKKTARIVVNGSFMTSVTGKDAETMYDQYRIAGAYYNISDSTGAFLVVEPVADAAANAAKAVDGIDIRGENSVSGVAFNGSEEKPLEIAVNGKLTGDITLDYATLDVDAQYTGTVTTAVGAVDLVNVKGIEVASVHEEVDGADVETMTVSGTPAKADAEGAEPSVTVASGEVTVPAGGLTIAQTTKKVDNKDVPANDVALEVANGATMTVNGKLTAYDITVYGELVSIDGGSVELTEAFVFGTLTVAADDTANDVAAGTAQIGTLYVGLDKKYDNIVAAAVNGDVTVTSKMIVSSQSAVDAEFLADFAESTAFNVEGSVWFTAYANSGVEVTVDDVKIENALFVGWSDEQDGEVIYSDAANKVVKTDFAIGDNEVLYAVINYEIYSIVITADGGIGTVAIDGKVLVKTGNQFVISGLKAGTHTIDYIVNAGFEGTPTISVNGTAITGNSFTLSGTSDADRNVSISIYGTQPSTSTGGSTTSGGDDGLGLTDILLIILVVLIVIMAVIVALRLMRS